jgi:hypothetical protein
MGEKTSQPAEKGTKVTVYYTEGAGKKIARFFDKGRRGPTKDS